MLVDSAARFFERIQPRGVRVEWIGFVTTADWHAVTGDLSRMEEAGIEQRIARAEEYCKEQIAWYESHGRDSRRIYKFFQVSAIVLGGITPVLILEGSTPSVLQALPAAIATISTALITSMHWKENWVRFAYSAERLRAELLAFETRTGESYSSTLTDENALERFVERLIQESLAETGEWTERLLNPPESNPFH